MNGSTFKAFDDLILSKGLRYDFVANKMGISTCYLWRLRKDPRKMNIKHMELLANVLEIDFFDVYELRKKFVSEVDKNTTKGVVSTQQPA
ncbi:hypothetical protein [Enterococcus faecalis]|uniref:hypothetical protein n=1 Tax=Enterococcus faecalis TaxID=1351 RepID=UPI0035F068FD